MSKRDAQLQNAARVNALVDFGLRTLLDAPETGPTRVGSDDCELAQIPGLDKRYLRAGYVNDPHPRASRDLSRNLAWLPRIIFDLEDDPSVILTKIIATVGPACSDTKPIMRMIEEGARVFRINFSHGTLETFEQAHHAVMQASEQTGVLVGVMGDISGPKLRIGQVEDAGIELSAGDLIEFRKEPVNPESDRAGHVVLGCSPASVLRDVKPGQRLLIDDGAVRTLVIDKTSHHDYPGLICRVRVGGHILSRKGINLPDSDLQLPSMSNRDRQCVDWAIERGLDFLALSFVRRVDDVRQLKAYLSGKQGKRQLGIPVIAKIEQPKALEDLEAIIDAADGVMVARGDLGVEMDLAQVPIAQKRIIRLAHDYGKPVIVATQMLQSMIQNDSPTRAEVSDVANAIFDGADAVMLSGETAVGVAPPRAVRMMARIAQAAQEHLTEFSNLTSGRWGDAPRKLQKNRFRTAALAHGVAVIVRDLGAKLVATWSQRGGGARYLSKNRLVVPIIAASSDPAALRQMTLMFAVVPVLMRLPTNEQALLDDLDRLILERNLAQPGDPVVLVKGDPIGIPGVTNQVRIHYLGDVCQVDHSEPHSLGET